MRASQQRFEVLLLDELEHRRAAAPIEPGVGPRGQREHVSEGGPGGVFQRQLGLEHAVDHRAPRDARVRGGVGRAVEVEVENLRDRRELLRARVGVR